jgi:hypothetical protein
VASIAAQEPAKRPPSGGRSYAPGSIHSATAATRRAAATAASSPRVRPGSSAPGARRHGPVTASAVVVAPKAANSATHAHAWRRSKSKTSRCTKVAASTNTDSTTAATTSGCAWRRDARSPAA